MAAGRGNLDILKNLVSNGAKVDSVDACGDTPLSVACLYGYYDLVEYLLENGANPLTKDKQGRTLLSFVKDERIRNLLIQFGASE